MKRIPSPSQLLEVTEVICEQIRTNARGPVTVNQKPDRSLVTNVDITANETVATWAKQFADIDFIGEEGANDLTNATDIIYIDPLDGTSTFVAGKAEVAVALTHMQRAGDDWEPRQCVIAEPLTGYIWAAAKGGGVHLKGPRDSAMRRIEAIMQTEPPYNVTAVTWTGVPFHLDAVQMALVQHQDLTEHGSGNTAINGALIASGWMHGLLFAGGSAVESAAISLMVSEAGGVVTDLIGNPLHSFALGVDSRSGKPDFLLENGIIAASSTQLSALLCNIVAEHNQ